MKLSNITKLLCQFMCTSTLHCTQLWVRGGGGMGLMRGLYRRCMCLYMCWCRAPELFFVVFHGGCCCSQFDKYLPNVTVKMYSKRRRRGGTALTNCARELYVCKHARNHNPIEFVYGGDVGRVDGWRFVALEKILHKF